MSELKKNIEWIKQKKLSNKIKQQMKELDFRSIGVCKKNDVAVAKINNYIVCSELNDDLCSDMDVCQYEAIEAEPEPIIFLCSLDLKNFLKDLKIIPSKTDPDISTQNKRGKKFDKFRKQAFAKLKFELTKRIAAETSDIKALNKALMEEFGISSTPPELIAVFNMEIKKNKAKDAGMDFTKYLLKEAEEKKKTISN